MSITEVKLPCLGVSFLIDMSSLICPEIFPQTTVCTASVYILPLADTSVQVTVVWLVVVGQLPQFDARMLYWTAGKL